MSGVSQKQRTILAVLLSFLILIVLAALLFALSLVVLPDAPVSLRVFLSILGAAVLGTAGFLSGFKDTYDLILELLDKLVPVSEPDPQPSISAGHQPEELEQVTMVDDHSLPMNTPTTQSGGSGKHPSCFISYSTRDKQFAERLYNDLTREGIECWFASEDMKIGARIRDSIDEAVLEHNKLLLVLSDQSTKSHWIEQEVETALERERQTNELVLFPIRLDDSVMDLRVGWAAHVKRTRHIGDFRNWKDRGEYKKAFRRLLRDLEVAEET